ncbi:MAG TPA: hypothetical protein VK980_13845 [Sphingomonas sp.]|nr:hypothetical protein [Sphingomonas sp.]
MNWVQLGGSVVAILVLAGIARMLRLGESRIATAADARRIAEESLAGFEARHAIVGTDGCAALVAGNGTIAVLKRHGAQVAVRRLVPPLRVREAVEGVTVETGERLFGAVTLLGVLPVDVQTLEAPLTLM